MIARALAPLLLVTAAPAFAQAMPGMAMPGMDMSKPMPPRHAPPAARKPVRPKAPVPHHGTHQTTAAPSTATAEDGMAGMDMTSGTGAAMSMPMPAAAAAEARGTDLAPGHAPPPAPPASFYADRSFAAADMARARAQMMREEGGQRLSQILFNLAEYQSGYGGGYRWDGEARFGGDRNRLVLKSEGEGGARHGLDSAEVQALYSRAIGPYFDLQAGIRQNIRPTPARTYATIGLEGLAPYRIETEAALFLSTQGDLLARVEAWYDQRLTQRLVLQPRVELNLSAQDSHKDRIGAGLTDAELGLRLRYEISRRFAPYLGLSYEAKTGETALFARHDGEAAHATRLVAGIRGWF